MSETTRPGFPPKDVTTLLRLEGIVVLSAAIAAYGSLGGNWWLFALLILAPDLSMLGALRGESFGARLYNAAHTYALPLALMGAAWAAGAGEAVPFLLVWVAHIGLDRALGYGLKYPGLAHQTHLGPIGKAKREARRLANAS